MKILQNSLCETMLISVNRTLTKPISLLGLKDTCDKRPS